MTDSVNDSAKLALSGELASGIDYTLEIDEDGHIKDITYQVSVDNVHYNYGIDMGEESDGQA